MGGEGTWQTRVETARINTIAYGADNATAPTNPSTGTAETWASEGSWTALSCNYAADDFTFTDLDGEPVIIKPPTGQANVARFWDTRGLDTVSFNTYEIGDKVYVLDTAMTESPTGTFSPAVVHTRKAICIEFAGLGIVYMPSCEVIVGTPTGGVKASGGHNCVIYTYATTSVVAAYQWIQNQDA